MGSAAWENACRMRWYLGPNLPDEKLDDDGPVAAGVGAGSLLAPPESVEGAPHAITVSRLSAEMKQADRRMGLLDSCDLARARMARRRAAVLLHP